MTLQRAVSRLLAVDERRPRWSIVIVACLLAVHSPERPEALTTVQAWLLVSRIPARFSAAGTSCGVYVYNKGNYCGSLVYFDQQKKASTTSERTHHT